MGSQTAPDPLTRTEPTRTPRRAVLLGMLAVGLLVVWAVPAGALDAEPEANGGLIVNTVINQVNEENVTNVLDLQVSGVGTDVLAGVDLGDDAAIAAALAAAGVDPASIGVSRSGPVFEGKTVTSENTVTVDVSPDAVYIGDLEGDPTLITVLEGTVTITDTTTVTTTNFFTSTVTVTGVLLVSPPPTDGPDAGPVDVAGESVSTPASTPSAASAPQPVSATPTFNG